MEEELDWDLVVSCRAVINGFNLQRLLWLSMLDFPLMLWLKLHAVNRIQPQSNKSAMGLENETTVDSKLNVQPCMYSEAVKTKAGLLKMATDMWGVGKMESMMLSDVLRSELKQKVLLNIECF